MERLTVKQSAGYELKALNSKWCNYYCEEQSIETCKECGIWEAVQKLAYYEDLEEQGKLIILSVEDIHPCKYCNKGWGVTSPKGFETCHETCERLKRYCEKYNT